MPNELEGQSILRNAFAAYYLKKRILEIEGIAIVRELDEPAGMPKLKLPNDIWNLSNQEGK